MSAWLDDQVGWVDELLDLLDGSDHVSRDESSAASSGPGPAGYEPCEDCRENLKRWPYCPVCFSTGWKKNGGNFDPYLKEREEVVFQAQSHERIPIYAGDWPEDSSELVVRILENGSVTLPALPEAVKLTTVERSVARLIGGRIGKALDALQRILDRAEVWIVEGAALRERDSMVWLAKRLAEQGVRVR